jgi:hypothetical protein
MLALFWILLRSSPDNYYTTRGVFEAPLFTKEECQHLIDMAEQNAQHNHQVAKNVTFLAKIEGIETNETIQGYLIDPVGWQKKRHGNYPTTDMNLVTDPFTKSDRAWLQEKWDARLAPTLGRLFGIPAHSIRAYDVSQTHKKVQ